MADSPIAAWLREDTGTPPDQQHDGDSPGHPADADHEQRLARPGVLLLLLAGVPWVVVAVLAVVLAGGRSPAAPPERPAAGAVGARTLDAVAAAVVADAVVRGGDYPGHVGIEAVERVGSLTVVRVVAAVLDGEDGVWTGGRLARYAVAVRVDAEGVLPLGEVWQLPPPAVATAPRRQVTDGELVAGVTAALAAAGYQDVSGIAVSVDPLLPDVLVAEMSARPPGGDRIGVHAVWLRANPTPAVLGLPRAETGAP